MKPAYLVLALAGIFALCFPATSHCQEPTTAPQSSPSPDRYAGLQKPDKQHYRVEVRFISVSERIYDFLKESARICETPKKAKGPFEGWQKLEPGQEGMVQKSNLNRPGSEFQLAMLNEAQMLPFIHAAQGDTRSNILLAPRLIVPAGETGTVSELTAVRCQKKSRTGENEILEVKEGTEISVRVTPVDQNSQQVDVALDFHELLNRAEIEVLNSGVLSSVPEHQQTSVGCSGIVKNEGQGNPTLVLLPAEFPEATEPAESPIRKVSQKIGLKPVDQPNHALVVCVTVLPANN